MGRQMDRLDRHKVRERGRERDRETDRETDRQTDRQTESETETDRDREEAKEIDDLFLTFKGAATATQIHYDHYVGV